MQSRMISQRAMQNAMQGHGIIFMGLLPSGQNLLVTYLAILANAGPKVRRPTVVGTIGSLRDDASIPGDETLYQLSWPFRSSPPLSSLNNGCNTLQLV